MFVEAFYSTIKDIHLVLEVKTSFINSVILNILTNAIKFSPGGSTVNIFGEKSGSSILLRVCDRGIGMPENILQKIFSLGHATSRPGTDKEEGTGFGMPLVKKFIDIYGGSIVVESVEGSRDQDNSGTTVTISLKPG